MLIDFNRPLTDINGAPLKKQADKEDVVTLSWIAIEALLQNDDKISGNEKLERYQLARKIHTAKIPIEIPLGEVVKIKDLVGRFYTPLVVGQVFEMLERL